MMKLFSVVLLSIMVTTSLCESNLLLRMWNLFYDQHNHIPWVKYGLPNCTTQRDKDALTVNGISRVCATELVGKYSCNGTYCHQLHAKACISTYQFFEKLLVDIAFHKNALEWIDGRRFRAKHDSELLKILG